MAGNTGLTAISKLQARPDPLLNFKWLVETLPEVGGVKLDTSYVESIDLPLNNITAGDNWYGGSGYTCFPGPHTISSVSITLYEDSKGSSLKWLTAWKFLVKDFSTGLYNLPSEFKKPMRVVLFDIKNMPVIRADIVGLFPLDTGNLSLNYTDSGRIILTQTLSVDDLITTIIN